MKKRFCVYTALIGGYDEVRQPLAVDEDFDYFLFSDDIAPQRIGVWEVRPFGYKNEIATKTSRWPKLHPHILLPDYEASVYVDANIIIRSDTFYGRVKELFEKGVKIASLIHPDWTCTYQELLHIMYLGWETERMTMEWGHFLRKEGFPREMGTFENRVIFRRHNNEKVIAIDELWWNCIERYARRDQLSFRYCLWKEKVDCQGFLPIGCSAKDNPYFELCHHKHHASKDVNVHDGKKENRSWLMRYYMKHADEKQRIEDVYYWLYGRKNYVFWFNVLGQYFRLWHLLLHAMGRKEVYLWEIDKNKYE